MKRVLVLAAVVILGVLTSGVASALPLCSTFNVGTSVPFNVWTAWTPASGLGCEIGDKVFTAFNVTAGSVPNDTTVQFTQSGNIITINFQNGNLNAFNNDFTVAYNVAIDPAFNPDGSANNSGQLWRIVRISAGLQDSTGTSVAALTKSCNPACSPTPSATLDGAGHLTQVVGNVNNATSVTVTDSYDYTSGVVTNISNSIFESNVPEPSTFILFGGALVGLGMLRRRRHQ
jgi:hypothetical protein